MKKNLIIILTVCHFTIISPAQYLTQSADGKSSIPLPIAGVGLGIDIGKAELAVGLNNYGKALKSPDNKHNTFLGLNLSVKNSSGIGNLFSSGNIVPSGDFLGFIGYTFSNNEKMLAKWNASPFVVNHFYARKIKRQIFDEYRSNVKNALDIAIVKIIDINLSTRIEDTLSKRFDASNDYLGIKNSIKNIKNAYNQSSLKDFWDQLEQLITIEKLKSEEKYDKIFTAEANKASAHDFDSIVSKIKPLRISPFLLGGINARNFSLFTKADPTNFANSFKDTLYRGGTFGIGINAQFNNIWLGLTYSYNNGDNFANLTSKEYTLRTVDTAGNQSLTREKKTTAYSGKYSKVETNQLNADLVWDIKISDSSRLLANAYLRSSLFSRDTAYLKNYSNIGIGLYFLGKKSKFLGGLYIELPDINNNFEKAKAPDAINIRPPLKKLSFGVVTKFSLSSIFSFQNRPRQPDPQ